MTAIPAQLLGEDGAVQRTRLAAYGWLEQDGAVLLVRIAPGYPDPGMWSLPGGGLDFGEDPADGARREVLEETGLEVALGEVAGVFSQVLDPSVTISGHRLHSLQIVYRAHVVGGNLRDEVGNSTDHAEWIPLDRLEALPIVDLVAWSRAATRS